MSPDRHIVAMGGGGFSMEPDNPLLDDFVLGLTRKARPRVCFLPTATSNVASYLATFYQAFARRAEADHLDLFARDGRDLRAFLLEQDVVYVGGESTANLLAIWRLHGLDAILREAWQQGTVMAGQSAGAICWFSHGVTDSFGPHLEAFDGGLGLIGGSFCPHLDGEAQRRPRLHQLLREGLPAGWAADDGAAVHFLGTDPAEAVASRPGATAYRVELRDGDVVEAPLDMRRLSG